MSSSAIVPYLLCLILISNICGSFAFFRTYKSYRIASYRIQILKSSFLFKTKSYAPLHVISDSSISVSFNQTIEANSDIEKNKHIEDDYIMRFNNVARLYPLNQTNVLFRLRTSNVVIIGLGGVGSWVVEALARSGISNLCLIDFDDICTSNVNRQLPALSSTIGHLKGDVLKRRVLDINPHANVTFIQDFVRPNNIDQILSNLGKIDYIVDCADGVTDKAAIVHYSVLNRIPIIVSGGAGGITDPTLIRLTDMARTLGCTLIMRVRKKLRQDYQYPPGKNTNGDGIKVDKKWGILTAHSLPIGVVRQSGENTGHVRKCDAVYGNTCFGTGTIGFVIGSAVVNAIALDDFIFPRRLGRMQQKEGDIIETQHTS